MKEKVLQTQNTFFHNCCHHTQAILDPSLSQPEFSILESALGLTQMLLPGFYVYNNNLKMIYFYQNPEYTVQWQQTYQELNMKCLQLSADYSKALQLRTSLKNKIQNLVKENEEIKRKRGNTKTVELGKEQLSIAESFQPCLEKITIKPEKMINQKIKVQRTAQSDTKLEGLAYACTYADCQKVYSSPVSMNLHIKIKHNGGTKKEREAYARILLQAEDRGEQHPKIDISLPPNFLKEYRTSYEYMKKYSM